MIELSDAKRTVLSYMAEFDAAAAEKRSDVLKAFAASEYRWRGLHPFNEQGSADSTIDAFWSPYLAAMSSVQRRQDVFFAGRNDCDGFETVWTCSMGHFMGLFDKPWLGIQPTRRMAFLRYAEFHRIDNGQIAETALFFDILHLMHQAGCYPLPPETGISFVQPGPRTNDGLLIEDTDPREGEKTLALVNRMAAAISDANVVLNNPNLSGPTPEEEMRQNWHEDMIWYGPAGIGSTYTIERYIEQHQQPFRQHLADRVFNGHVARCAEGNYCGFFGWPNLTLMPSGGYLGLPRSDKPADMRVVDIYRRDGDRLAENWVFIDMLHFLKMQGLDVLKRNNEI